MFAVCCGGDYDKEGLPGCGRETALGLACCMNGDMLRTALGSNDLDQSLQHWRDTARYHPANDPTGEMGRSHPALARSLPGSFPEPHVVDLYAQPAVTPLAELPYLQSPTSPDVARLASLVQQLLGWDSEGLVSTFRTAIWLLWSCMSSLKTLRTIRPQAMRYCVQVDLASGCMRAVFYNRARRLKKVLAGVSGHDNNVPTRDLTQTTLQLLEGSPGSSRHQNNTTSGKTPGLYSPI
ncbi:hypothetical protein M405DRAFT_870107 [Rhizopogon salebrosus TDB-379]|nr:hypothetical protein M405DRAFT_870107 [Rhizopogon salebrosus TDB-379]